MRKLRFREVLLLVSDRVWNQTQVCLTLSLSSEGGYIMLDRSCKPWKPVSSFESQMISEVLLNLRMGWSCYIKTFDSRKKKTTFNSEYSSVNETFSLLCRKQNSCCLSLHFLVWWSVCMNFLCGYPSHIWNIHTMAGGLDQRVQTQNISCGIDFLMIKGILLNTSHFFLAVYKTPTA